MPFTEQLQRGLQILTGPLYTVVSKSGWLATPDYSYPRLPPLADIHDIDQKKQLFFDYLAPAVSSLNQRIATQRRWLQQLPAWQFSSKASRHRWQALLAEYRQQDDLPLNQKNRQALLLLVDEIPTALVLIQAANESGWGTSRFATEGNNLFGQWCFTTGCGLVPHGRPTGERYEVQLFSSVKESIHSYLLNLNTHRSYRELRAMRNQMREAGEELDATRLAEGLGRYSTRGEAYIAELQSMMRQNAHYLEQIARG